MKLNPSDLEEFHTMLLGRARSLRYLWDWPREVEVEDVVSATITRALERIDQFHGETRGEAASWLLSILYSQTIDTLRKSGAQKRNGGRVFSFEEFISHSDACLQQMLAAESSTPSAKVQKQELIQAAYAAIEELPERQKMALLARFIGQWPIAKIVEEMNHLQSNPAESGQSVKSPVTEKTVTSLIERALRKLRDLLEHLE